MTDGSSVFGTLVDNKQKKIKKIEKIFRDKSLQINIKCNLKKVGYLDVTLNLDDGTYPLFINLIRKQITSISNPTIPHKLLRKSQILLKRDYPAYLQQRKYLKIQK